mmetsp:Transcript_2549/g.10181  ORF Transcript_2549/g.10181 Transcript_2549/m.10181 type:complete len:356 (+) Transcript_2549:1254-2321(+)
MHPVVVSDEQNIAERAELVINVAHLALDVEQGLPIGALIYETHCCSDSAPGESRLDDAQAFGRACPWRQCLSPAIAKHAAEVGRMHRKERPVSRYRFAAVIRLNEHIERAHSWRCRHQASAPWGNIGEETLSAMQQHLHGRLSFRAWPNFGAEDRVNHEIRAALLRERRQAVKLAHRHLHYSVRVCQPEQGIDGSPRRARRGVNEQTPRGLAINNPSRWRSCLRQGWQCRGDNRGVHHDGTLLQAGSASHDRAVGELGKTQKITRQTALPCSRPSVLRASAGALICVLRTTVVVDRLRPALLPPTSAIGTSDVYCAIRHGGVPGGQPDVANASQRSRIAPLKELVVTRLRSPPGR